ncbi:hypothetical protein [Serratia sp. M24T3]|uniref:Uncharacterized protein n=1 Tax=Rouxiella sp. WC2420 TaxID=3234145 RepID=A0AB39VUS1_9GAMM|nr:hypothetical protein [Serratia sp. M24T3]
MTSSKVLLAAMVLAGAAFGTQASEIPMNTSSQPCVEHSSFNNVADARDMMTSPQRPAHQSATHCLTSIQNSNSNKLFGNNELFK